MLRLSVAGDLTVEVSDDGVGIAAQPSPGVGLPSMADRAAELGGELHHRPGRGRRHPRARPSPAGRGMTPPLRVLVADDHPVFRKGLCALLASLPEARSWAKPPTANRRWRWPRRCAPDVIVMDLHMPSVNGVEATRSIVGASPDTGVLVLTMFEDDDSVFAAMRAGARGYLVKGSDTDEVVAAITAVGRGEAIFGPQRRPADPVLPHQAAIRLRQQLFPELSRREREVLDLIAAGVANADIANDSSSAQDGAQPHIQHLRQAAGGRPRPGNRPGPALLVSASSPATSSNGGFSPEPLLGSGLVFLGPGGRPRV